MLRDSVWTISALTCGRLAGVQHGLPRERIVECGASDNFWSMGDGAGPCGPCTEIFVEQAQPDSDGERCDSLACVRCCTCLNAVVTLA